MKCSTKYCRNTTKENRSICDTCRKREWRVNNPIRDAYSNLKSHAKQRGKEFDLTFEEFKEFAVRVDLIKNKGITKDSYHVDRVDDNKGYTKDNIQVLTNSENVRKENNRRKVLQYDWMSKMGQYSMFDPNDIKGDAPF